MNNQDRKNFNFLCSKYQDALKREARKVMSIFNRTPLEADDLVNVALFNLPQIERTYSSKYNIPKDFYMVRFAYFDMLKYAKKFTNSNSQIMNGRIEEWDIENYSRADDEGLNDEEQMALNKEIKHVFDNLSSFEKNVFEDFFVKRNEMRQIATQLKVSTKSVANAINRARQKFRSSSASFKNYQ